ncbi:hypothetical protein GE09DRAFT_1189665 [Coniochaeta sp. 2T2.1]|nr:hypothetical protein GE09DRAFT_1189665 [Coniochaeta sp. 2T2.1]
MNNNHIYIDNIVQALRVNPEYRALVQRHTELTRQVIFWAGKVRYDADIFNHDRLWQANAIYDSAIVLLAQMLERTGHVEAHERELMADPNPAVYGIILSRDHDVTRVELEDAVNRLFQAIEALLLKILTVAYAVAAEG